MFKCSLVQDNNNKNKLGKKLGGFGKNFKLFEYYGLFDLKYFWPTLLPLTHSHTHLALLVRFNRYVVTELGRKKTF